MLPLHCDIQTFIEYAVAPYVGAWIETQKVANILVDWVSHPTWVRGLKHITLVFHAIRIVSHPTWVRGLKQQMGVYSSTGQMSHPTWVRGLKPSSDLSTFWGSVSHPTWVRGLKQKGGVGIYCV